MQVDVEQFYLLKKSYTVYQKQVIKTIRILSLLDLWGIKKPRQRWSYYNSKYFTNSNPGINPELELKLVVDFFKGLFACLAKVVALKDERRPFASFQNLYSFILFIMCWCSIKLYLYCN